MNEKQTISLTIKSSKQMIKLGYIIGKMAYKQMVIALNGDLGAGKTTLTKGIGQALGVKQTINSPTFTIMKIYLCNHESIKNLYHLDVYRTLGSKNDDLEEYFYLDGIAVIEWAKMIEDLLPVDVIDISLTITGPSMREITISSINETFIKQLFEQLIREGYYA